MYKVQTFNKIDAEGLALLPKEQYEVSAEAENPDAIIVRSYDLHSMDFPSKLKAIARAGAGYNNIPVDACSERGIIVFNTPGANANGVKELVFAGMFLASRNLSSAISWVQSIKDKGDEVPKLIEKEKSNFKGTELKGKTLGVIGLGAIGMLVANDAAAFGMEVVGCDPFISVDTAWVLSRKVKKASCLEKLLSVSDYISIHVPLSNETRGMFNEERFGMMKKGAAILNFARGGLVDHGDLKKALKEGIISKYVTDFPDGDILKTEGVIPIPHLGASTKESEVNCAIMAVNQIREYLETGNLKNSVNFPGCEMQIAGDTRIVIASRNTPNIIGEITALLASEGIHYSDMLNRHRDEYAYTLIDVQGTVSGKSVEKIRNLEGVIMVRVLENPGEGEPHREPGSGGSCSS